MTYDPLKSNINHNFLYFLTWIDMFLDQMKHDHTFIMQNDCFYLQMLDATD